MFVIKLLDEVTGRFPFYKLIKNGKCQFDEFIDQLEKFGNMDTDIEAIFNIINRKANGHDVPPTMFKQLHGNENVKDFEVRKGAIRIYVAKYLNGYLIILGGLKPDQDRDIDKMRTIKTNFFTSINLKK